MDTVRFLYINADEVDGGLSRDSVEKSAEGSRHEPGWFLQRLQGKPRKP